MEFRCFPKSGSEKITFEKGIFDNCTVSITVLASRPVVYLYLVFAKYHEHPVQFHAECQEHDQHGQL